MYRHLVSIEVGIVRRRHQWVQTDGAAFDKRRLERLDTQTVERWCTVEEDRVFFDDIFKNIPYIIFHTLDLAFGVFDVCRHFTFYKLFHYERLEEFKCHFLRQSALIHLQAWSNNDYGTA